MIVTIYMNDLIIPSINLQDGLSRLKLVLETARHVVENGNITLSDKKTYAVKHFPKPMNVRSVQSFLDLTEYFQKFIPQYSLIPRPLAELLQNEVDFKFGKEQEQAFEQLKIALSRKPVLCLYCPTAETELHTDVSASRFGAVLL
ncbi:PREDICTED: uncharacterized mitochondrial protein AtMg00860-like [Dinoponera quadriceps]|uniref:RNA-directed DNA polymerase n=1 Tax=Dinoponera quadriceps TaxID=609295 RepID=A0A6P3Y563_DINQU|nr:PREDICTED: uncharacterized mitochondrial protein AtMg00860-like [Dinoponera quadriceps]